MTSRLKNITVDCHDTFLLSRFWAEVTGYSEVPDDPNLFGDDEAVLIGPDASPVLLFIGVPEGKTVKNRVHLDIEPSDRSRDDEVERLLSIGATLMDDCRRPDGTGWVVLADPEGNEFCVERSAAERAAA